MVLAPGMIVKDMMIELSPPALVRCHHEPAIRSRELPCSNNHGALLWLTAALGVAPHQNTRKGGAASDVAPSSQQVGMVNVLYIGITAAS